MLRRLSPLLVVWSVCLPFALRVAAAEPPVKELDAKQAAAKETADEATKFLRISRDDDGDLVSMDTAIVRYAPKAKEPGKEGVVVDLIGVVHVGEKSYYRQLNKAFEQYDALLYELVAPEGKNVPKQGDQSRHPLAAMQNGMKDVLELEYQLQHIDYQKKNFVHADMSPEAFSKSMEDRGESIWQMLLRSMGQNIAMSSRQQSGGTSGAALLMAWFSPNRSLVLKRMMAEQFEDLDASMKTFDGPDGSTIISERNKVALKVLAEQVAAGKKRIGIFYGAGHMADMEKRLLDEFGFERQGQKWLVAWDLKSKSQTAGNEEKPETEKPEAGKPEAEKLEADRPEKPAKEPASR